jgi:hypothetical protein
VSTGQTQARSSRPTPSKRTARAPRKTSAAASAARPRQPGLHALIAAEQAVQRDALRVRLPVIGELRLPARDEVVFLGGVVVLAVIGVLEWPVAVLLGVGHELAANRHHKVLRAFGEALEEA